MSQEMIAALAERLEADVALRGALSRATDPEEAARVLTAAGFTVAARDIDVADGSNTLTDSELEAVSGGMTDSEGNLRTLVRIWTVCI